MDYNAEGWREVADKIAPFLPSPLLDSPGNYQWLTNESDIKVLLSPSGQW